MILYLDCNGSTPVEPAVLQRFTEHALSYTGNLSAPHAKRGREALREAQHALTSEIGCDIIFCASATEANNIAIQGLLEFAESSGKKHIVLSAIEHASVMETCQFLARSHGFELSIVKPEAETGRMLAAAVMEQVRADTLLVACMQVNNETGTVQPVAELGEALSKHEAYFLVDAVQGIAHVTEELYPEASLGHPRIDMISISGHKCYGLCGIAALLLKTSSRQVALCRPIVYGGSQQKLRSGSIPLALALSLCDAIALAESERAQRRAANLVFREKFLEVLVPLEPQINGEHTLPHVLNVSLPGIDAESALLNLRGLLAASRGAACSSDNRVLAAMGFDRERQRSALRFSWCHRTPQPWESDWAEKVLHKLRRLKH